MELPRRDLRQLQADAGLGRGGSPRRPAITAAERAEGKILTCCAVPLTDLEIL